VKGFRVGYCNDATGSKYYPCVTKERNKAVLWSYGNTGVETRRNFKENVVCSMLKDRDREVLPATTATRTEGKFTLLAGVFLGFLVTLSIVILLSNQPGGFVDTVTRYREHRQHWPFIVFEFFKVSFFGLLTYLALVLSSVVFPRMTKRAIRKLIGALEWITG
jgi:hypothetical protein